MKGGVNTFIVSLGKETHNDKMSHGSLEIVVDTGFRPEWHLKTSAPIVAKPLKVSPAFQPFIDVLSDDFKELHFDYKAINEEMMFHENGEILLFIPIELVFGASTDDGKLAVNVGVAICEPVYGKNVEKMTDGSYLEFCGDIVIDHNPKPDDRIARIKEIGAVSPLMNEFGLKTGDLVFRDEATNYKYEISGETLWVVRHQNLVAFVEDETEIEIKGKKKHTNYDGVVDKSDVDGQKAAEIKEITADIAKKKYFAS